VRDCTLEGLQLYYDREWEQVIIARHLGSHGHCSLRGWMYWGWSDEEDEDGKDIGID